MHYGGGIVEKQYRKRSSLDSLRRTLMDVLRLTTNILHRNVGHEGQTITLEVKNNNIKGSTTVKRKWQGIELW